MTPILGSTQYIYAQHEKNLRDRATYDELGNRCRKDDHEGVKSMLDAGANPNLCFYTTLLSDAVAFPRIVQLLIDKGADVNKKNDTGPAIGFESAGTALHTACGCACDATVDILLKAKADRTLTNAWGYTPLEVAKWQLNNHITKPSNPPQVTQNIIERLKRIVAMLEV